LLQWQREKPVKINVREKQLLDYAGRCLKPSYDYFKLKFDQDLKPVINAFIAARLFSP